jgi:hypothetical protein
MKILEPSIYKPSLLLEDERKASSVFINVSNFQLKFKIFFVPYIKTLHFKTKEESWMEFFFPESFKNE